jgi:SAM-dependent methyltransferase
MTSVKEHYDNLLAEHYTWMFGEHSAKVLENIDFFESLGVKPGPDGRALDLGCGSGFQSIALAKLGFKVVGIDVCQPLLDELRSHSSGLGIEVVHGDMLDSRIFSDKGPFEIAVCMGDTLTHLQKAGDVLSLFENVYRDLVNGGRLVLTFRDLTTELKGLDRLIPVRTDENKLMAVFLEYEETNVKVHDMIFIKGTSGWDLKKSVYKKLRLGADQIEGFLENIDFKITSSQEQEGFTVIVAQK